MFLQVCLKQLHSDWSDLSVVVSQILKDVEDEVTVHLPLGKLFIRKNKDGSINMEGPCVDVFEGIYKE